MSGKIILDAISREESWGCWRQWAVLDECELEKVVLALVMVVHEHRGRGCLLSSECV